MREPTGRPGGGSSSEPLVQEEITAPRRKRAGGADSAADLTGLDDAMAPRAGRWFACYDEPAHA